MRTLIRWVGVVGCVLALLPGVAWGGIHSPLYKQVLDKLQQLTPGDKIALDIGVEPGHYQTRFQITEATLVWLRQSGVAEDVVTKLAALNGQDFTAAETFVTAVEGAIGKENSTTYAALIMHAADEGMAAFAYGDQFEIRFQASQPCYATMIHIADEKNEDGGITFLLPNREFSDAKIEAGKAYSTTQNFNIQVTVGAPSAYEMVNLMCSQDKIDWFGADAGKDAFYAIMPTDEKRLQHLLKSLEQLERSEWSGTSMPLQIIPKLGGVRDLPRKAGAIPPIGATGTTGKGQFFPPIGTTGTTGVK